MNATKLVNRGRGVYDPTREVGSYDRTRKPIPLGRLPKPSELPSIFGPPIPDPTKLDDHARHYARESALRMFQEGIVGPEFCDEDHIRVNTLLEEFERQTGHAPAGLCVFHKGVDEVYVGIEAGNSSTPIRPHRGRVQLTRAQYDNGEPLALHLKPYKPPRSYHDMVPEGIAEHFGILTAQTRGEMTDQISRHQIANSTDLTGALDDITVVPATAALYGTNAELIPLNYGKVVAANDEGQLSILALASKATHVILQEPTDQSTQGLEAKLFKVE